MSLWPRKITHKNGTTREIWYGSLSIPTGLTYPSGRPIYKQKTFAIGDCAALSKRKAQQKYEREKQRILDEEAPNESDDITIAEFEPAYLKYSREIAKKKSIRADVLSLKHVKRILGANRPISDVKEADLIEYQHTRLSEGVSNATINRELAVFRHFINIAQAEGKFTTATPFTKKFRMLTPADNRDRILTESEEKALADYLQYHQWIIVDVALNTACRLGELLTMKWEYVNFKRRIITIPRVNVKRELSVKVIDINEYLYDVLKEHQKKTGKFEFVFLTPNKDPYQRDSLEFFPRACKALGIKGVTFHTLRHTAITRMLAENNPIDSVARIAGHRSVTTTMLYAHRNPSDKTAVESLNKYRRWFKKEEKRKSS